MVTIKCLNHKVTAFWCVCCILGSQSTCCNVVMSSCNCCHRRCLQKDVTSLWSHQLIVGWGPVLNIKDTILSNYFKLVRKDCFMYSDKCSQLRQPHCQNKCWHHVFLQTTDMLKLYVSSHFNFMLWQHCGMKKTFVRVRKVHVLA